MRPPATQPQHWLVGWILSRLSTADSASANPIPSPVGIVQSFWRWWKIARILNRAPVLRSIDNRRRREHYVCLNSRFTPESPENPLPIYMFHNRFTVVPQPHLTCSDELRVIPLRSIIRWTFSQWDVALNSYACADWLPTGRSSKRDQIFHNFKTGCRKQVHRRCVL